MNHRNTASVVRTLATGLLALSAQCGPDLLITPPTDAESTPVHDASTATRTDAQGDGESDTVVDDGIPCVRAGTASTGTLVLGPVVHAATPPPPLSGGTLLVTHDTHYAIVADPDRDRIWIADLALRQFHAPIVLESGAEPGRAVEDARGNVFVVLRGANAVVAVRPADGAVLARLTPCSAPRGIAYDAASDTVHVACATGELVSYAAGATHPTRTIKLDSDLRDVVVDGPQLLVSRFRSAEVLMIDSRGQLVRRVQLPGRTRAQMQPAGRTASIEFTPDVAWRMVGRPSGGGLVLHQEAQSSLIAPPAPGAGYYTAQFVDGCGPGLLHATVSATDADGHTTQGPIFAPTLVLPLDLALSVDGSTAAIATAGTVPDAPARFRWLASSALWSTTCEGAAGGALGQDVHLPVRGRVVAVAFIGAHNDTVAVQTRGPSALYVVNVGEPLGLLSMPFGTGDAIDTGHEMFHSAFDDHVSCAGCHPEGNDDGHVWTFPCDGARRTQPLRGGLLATAPFHWDGHLADFAALTDEVFGERLGVARPTPEQSAALGRWVDALGYASTLPPSDNAAVARGRALFNDPSVGCNACHGGARLTNNATVDVGTGGAFQVPSLTGVRWRAPYLHNGCAATLRDRFGTCGGGDRHGHTSQLSDAQLADIVTFMESL